MIGTQRARKLRATDGNSQRPQILGIERNGNRRCSVDVAGGCRLYGVLLAIEADKRAGHLACSLFGVHLAELQLHDTDDIVAVVYHARKRHRLRCRIRRGNVIFVQDFVVWARLHPLGVELYHAILETSEIVELLLIHIHFSSAIRLRVPPGKHIALTRKGVSRQRRPDIELRHHVCHRTRATVGIKTNPIGDWREQRIERNRHFNGFFAVARYLFTTIPDIAPALELISFRRFRWRFRHRILVLLSNRHHHLFLLAAAAVIVDLYLRRFPTRPVELQVAGRAVHASHAHLVNSPLHTWEIDATRESWDRGGIDVLGNRFAVGVDAKDGVKRRPKRRELSIAGERRGPLEPDAVRRGRLEGGKQIDLLEKQPLVIERLVLLVASAGR